MKQKDFFSSYGGSEFKSRKEHGGAHSVGVRRSRRPLSTKHSLHITLRSEFAYGKRSLLRHRPRIERILKKAASRFQISVYRYAVCSNHLHLLIRGKTRLELQNFFRVFAGHLAQEILRDFPLSNLEKGGTAPREISQKARRPGGAPDGAHVKPKTIVKSTRSPHPKNQRKFWSELIYSRVVSWGREFKNVTKYILQNTLEALYLIAYKPRKLRRGLNKIEKRSRSDSG